MKINLDKRMLGNSTYSGIKRFLEYYGHVNKKTLCYFNDIDEDILDDLILIDNIKVN